MADIRAEDLTQETKATLDGSEQFIMFDSQEGKRGTVSAVGDYILQNGDASGSGDTVADLVDGKQDALVSGTNIKTVNGTSVLGSGNIQIQSGDTVTVTQTQTSGNQIGSISVNGNSTTLYSKAETDPVYSASPAAGITSSDISAWNGKQDALVSGTNIKTINNISVLGSGNINIEGGGGGASQNVWYATCPTGTSTATKVVTTTSGDFVLTAGNTVSVTFTYTGDTSVNCSLNVDGSGAVRAIAAEYSGSISNPIWSAGDTIAFTYDGTYFRAINARMASTGAYGKTVLNTSTSSTSMTEAATPSAVKAAYDLANGKQDTLVSGTNIKTINSTSLLGSGNIAVQTAITSQSVSISVANWNATTTCTKSVTGVTSSNNVIVTPAPASINTWNSNGVYCSAQGSGTLTFTASTTPSADMTVNVMII